MKPVADDVRRLILDWAQKNDGRVYAPIPHPDFSTMPFSHGPERFEIIRSYLGFPGGSVLDIGSHWGYMAHRLEELGYRVTAVEHADHLYRVLNGLREAGERKFTAVHASIFDIQHLRFDIIVALNIFHHFLKKKPRFECFISFLKRVECAQMIFQTHREDEPQMKGSFVNLSQDAFASLVASVTGLTKVKLLGSYHRRNIYSLTRK